jgi:hypothetical protein
VLQVGDHGGGWVHLLVTQSGDALGGFGVEQLAEGEVRGEAAGRVDHGFCVTKKKRPARP